LATEIALPRLEPTEVDAMLRAIFDLKRPAAANFLHVLYALTEGNPFFIEELLRSIVAAGNVGDASVRATVSPYLDHEDEILRDHAAWALARLDERHD
jgi:hypothetical protein